MHISRRTKLLGCLIPIIVGIGLFAWFASMAIPLMRYGQRSRNINHKICALENRRPPNVDPELWHECIAWASIAHGNICFSEGLTSYSAMCRFDEQLDEKLKGEVSMDTIHWIGERLAETGPHGERYMMKWRKQWQEMRDNSERKQAD